MRADRIESLVDVLLPGGALPNGILAPPGSATTALARASAILAEPCTAGLAAALEGRAAIDDAALREIESPHRADFSRLVSATLAAYYEAPAVLMAFGWRATPPHPDGHTLESFETSLLDSVRRREPFWRR